MTEAFYEIESLESRRNAIRKEIERIRHLADESQKPMDERLKNQLKRLETLKRKLNESIEKLLYSAA
jgi:seryl-tRNA synthetase